MFHGLPSYDAAGGASVRTRPGVDVEAIVRPLVMVALLVWAAIAFGAWVLWIGFWILLPRLGRAGIVAGIASSTSGRPTAR